MPRRSKANLRPLTIKPDNWKKQVEEGIGKYHQGLGPDDFAKGRWRPGGVAPRALAMLMSAEDEVIEILKDLVAENRGKHFDRYDTNDGNGIDLAELLSQCAIWGKLQRDPAYDLKRIIASDVPDTVQKKELGAIADAGLVPRGEGRPEEVYGNHLAWRLNEILRNRFMRKGQAFDDVIWKFLKLAGLREIDRESVRNKILAGSKQLNDPRITRRVAKLERITGSPDGRVKS